MMLTRGCLLVAMLLAIAGTPSQALTYSTHVATTAIGNNFSMTVDFTAWVNVTQITELDWLDVIQATAIGYGYYNACILNVNNLGQDDKTWIILPYQPTPFKVEALLRKNGTCGGGVGGLSFKTKGVFSGTEIPASSKNGNCVCPCEAPPGGGGGGGGGWPPQ